MVVGLQWLNHVKNFSAYVFCQFQESKHHNFLVFPATSPTQTDPINTQGQTNNRTSDGPSVNQV